MIADDFLSCGALYTAALLWLDKKVFFVPLPMADLTLKRAWAEQKLGLSVVRAQTSGFYGNINSFVLITGACGLCYRGDAGGKGLVFFFNFEWSQALVWRFKEASGRLLKFRQSWLMEEITQSGNKGKNTVRWVIFRCFSMSLFNKEMWVTEFPYRIELFLSDMEFAGHI